MRLLAQGRGENNQNEMTNKQQDCVSDTDEMSKREVNENGPKTKEVTKNSVKKRMGYRERNGFSLGLTSGERGSVGREQGAKQQTSLS